MLVEFKLGRGMFMCLYCGWYEVKRKENKKMWKKKRLEKENKKKSFEKEKQKE